MPLSELRVSRKSQFRGSKRNGILRKNEVWWKWQHNNNKKRLYIIKSIISVQRLSQNSECFLFMQNGSEWNEIPSTLIFREMFREKKCSSVFLFNEMVQNGILSFFYLPSNGFRSAKQTEWIKISVCSVFRGIIFFAENGKPYIGVMHGILVWSHKMFLSLNYDDLACTSSATVFCRVAYILSLNPNL